MSLGKRSLNLGVIFSSLVLWQGIITPTTSNAIPLADFTGHSENLSSVVNFAVPPPGDRFTQVLTPYFQRLQWIECQLKSSSLHLSVSDHKSIGSSISVFPIN
jgi:hypothetical protein